MQFKNFKDRNLADYFINVSGKGECVLKIEWWYRLVEERGRHHYYMVLFEYFPWITCNTMITKYLTKFVTQTRAPLTEKTLA